MPSKSRAPERRRADYNAAVTHDRPWRCCVKLYEFGPTRSIRARWTLQELGVDFESVPVNLLKGEHHRPEFLAVNRAAKIPVR